MNPVIVIVAYNRPLSLMRLLESIENAYYDEMVEMVISIDGGGSDEVISIAEEYYNEKINKIIIKNEYKLGLKEHIIKCGDLVDKFGSIIILEDDLVVDKYYYYYAKNSLLYYEAADNVAGIALYAYEWNEYVNYPFRPLDNGYSTYLMQVVCSWGQCWSKKQWSRFKSWYEVNQVSGLCDSIDLPEIVKNWPETSWKKYYSAYIVDCKKYFVYPYNSYSTNCADSGGEHVVNGSIYYHVSMGSNNRPLPIFNFVDAKDSEVLYDSSMNPVGDFVYRSLGIKRDEVLIDLFGIKNKSLYKKYKYILSTKLNGRCISIYSVRYRPIEVNLLYPESHNVTNGLFLIYSDGYERVNTKCADELLSYYAGYDLMRKKNINCIIKGWIRRVLEKMKKK